MDLETGSVVDTANIIEEVDRAGFDITKVMRHGTNKMKHIDGNIGVGNGNRREDVGWIHIHHQMK